MVPHWWLHRDIRQLRKKGVVRTEDSFMEFRIFMSQCNLFDLRHTGNFLSWRGIRHSHTVHCRLDRAISNSTAAEEFPSGRCSYLALEGSDHRPVLTYFEPDTKKRRGLFWYDRKLCKNEEVKRLIEETWNLHYRSTVERKITAWR